MGMIRQKALAGAVALALATGWVAGCAQMSRMMGGDKSETARAEQVTLSGRNEVPTVDTSASGTATVTVNADRTVTARVTVTGMTANAAHIHQGARGANGPVIVPFTKSADNTFVAPAGAKMTEEQYAAYKAGNTYVNVHSTKNPGGEVRGQLRGS
jgi:CHRD domain-containing protein